MFYWQATEHTLQTFKNLNASKNNRLTPEELLEYKPGLTNAFITRVFEETPGSGTMVLHLHIPPLLSSLMILSIYLKDLKEFLNFTFAMENKSTPQGLTYFFKIFDLDKKGYLTKFDLHYFLKVLPFPAPSASPSSRLNIPKDILGGINDETVDAEDAEDVFPVYIQDVMV